jgi:hypothetical protein
MHLEASADESTPLAKIRRLRQRSTGAVNA